MAGRSPASVRSKRPAARRPAGLRLAPAQVEQPADQHQVLQCRSGPRRPRRTGRSARSAGAPAAASATTSRPPTGRVPPSGRSSVARMRTAVVLPAPFGPEHAEHGARPARPGPRRPARSSRRTASPGPRPRSRTSRRPPSLGHPGSAPAAGRSAQTAGSRRHRSCTAAASGLPATRPDRLRRPTGGPAGRRRVHVRLRQPAAEHLGRPPVPPAEQGHRRRQQHRPDQRRVEQDRPRPGRRPSA